MIRWLSTMFVVAAALFLAAPSGHIRADDTKKADNDKKDAPSEEHGFLGVQPDQNSEGGVAIDSVIDDSPAAKAGMKAGDKITKIDGKEVKGLEELHTMMMKTKPGQTVEVTAMRGDKEMKFKVTLAKPPNGPNG